MGIITTLYLSLIELLAALFFDKLDKKKLTMHWTGLLLENTIA
jgi:hypothetical protein